MSLTDRSFKTLLVSQVDDGVLEVRLNRPDRLNALSAPLIADLIDAFEGLNADRSTRAVILTGEGRGFCSGADLQETSGPGGIPGTEGMGELGYVYKFQEYLVRAVLAIHECDKPVIAAVGGVAVGGGLALALASDVRIASEQARFGAVFIKTGLSACDVGCSYLLPRVVGAGIASELMLTGRIINAAEAREIRLANRVVAPEALAEAALDQARQIRENSEYGVWMTKKGLRSALDAPSLRHAIEMENHTQVLGYFTGCMTARRESFARGEKTTAWPKL